MAEICHDWNTLDDKKEIEIIKKYACFINKYTISSTGKERKHLWVPLSLFLIIKIQISSNLKLMFV